MSETTPKNFQPTQAFEINKLKGVVVIAMNEAMGREVLEALKDREATYPEREVPKPLYSLVTKLDDIVTSMEEFRTNRERRAA